MQLGRTGWDVVRFGIKLGDEHAGLREVAGHIAG